MEESEIETERRDPVEHCYQIPSLKGGDLITKFLLTSSQRGPGPTARRSQ